MITQIQSLARPEIHVVGKGDSAGNIAEAFFRVSHAEVLVESLGAIDRRLLHTLTATHVVGRAITLEAAVVSTARTASGIVRTVAFDDVVLDQWIARPTVKRQIRVLAAANTVVARVVQHARTAARIPAFAAHPVVGITGPLGGITAARLQGHRRAARVFPEGVVIPVVGAG